MAELGESAKNQLDIAYKVLAGKPGKKRPFVRYR
jgi:hypothetical protein